MINYRPKILKVGVTRHPRRSPQETFEVSRTLFSGYRVESSAISLPKSQGWRDELDLEGFKPPTPEKIEARLLRRGGRKKGRVLKLYQQQTMIAVLSCHIDPNASIVVLHADSCGLSADRGLQLKLLVKALADVNAHRERKRAKKPILWKPHSAEQMRLAGSLGFTEIAQPGCGRKLPVLRRPG